MAKQKSKPVVELSAEQEALAQRVYEKIRGKAEEELRGMVRLTTVNRVSSESSPQSCQNRSPTSARLSRIPFRSRP